MTEPSIITTEPVTVAFITMHGPYAQTPEGLGRLYGWIGQHGLQPAGMPAAVYRWFYRAHSVKSLERNILGFVGFAPVHETLIGNVGNLDAKQAAKWLGTLRKAGAEGE